LPIECDKDVTPLSVLVKCALWQVAKCASVSTAQCFHRGEVWGCYETPHL